MGSRSLGNESSTPSWPRQSNEPGKLLVGVCYVAAVGVYYVAVGWWCCWCVSGRVMRCSDVKKGWGWDGNLGPNFIL